MVKTNHIAAIIPAYSSREVVNNSVLSLATQWIPDNTFHLEIVIVNDNPGKMEQYNYYISEDFKKNILKPHINIRLIKHSSNLGQGRARNTGIGDINGFFVLCDEDDIYAPNALYRMWEIIQKEHYNSEDPRPVSILTCPIYSFDKDMYRHIIPSASIWVNAKLYNKEFLDKYGIRFPIDECSHRAEDYPFSRMVDYASRNDKSFKRIDLPNDTDTVYYWYPNHNSRSRQDKFYGSMLSGYTMKGSVNIINFIKNFNEKYIIPDKQGEADEYLKQEILNMNIYSYYNFLSFLKDLSLGWQCKEEYWNILVSSIKSLREQILPYWEEYCPSDIADMLYRVKHHSDIRFTESWIGSFESFINKENSLLNKSFNYIVKYAKKLKFDSCNHEVNSSYVKAWNKRHCSK